MQEHQSAVFEASTLGLVSVLEHVPIPVAVAFGSGAERIVGNAAFRRLAGNDGERAPGEFPLRRAAAGDDVGDYEFTLTRLDGSSTEMVASAWPLRDDRGNVHGSIGVFIDVTERRHTEEEAANARRALENSERRYRLIAEAMPQFVWLDAPDGSAIYANQRWLDYTGLSDDENRGFGWERVVHPDDRRRLDAERRHTLVSGETYEGECRYRGRDGRYRWFLFRSIPVRDENGAVASWLGTATDIDRQKRAEAQQRFFAQASANLSSTLDVDTALERMAQLAISSLGTWCQVDLADENGILRTVTTAHRDPQKAALLKTLVGREYFNAEATAGPPYVLRTGEPQIIPRTDEAVIAHVIPDADVRAIYREIGYACGLIVPLKLGERTLGVLGIASDVPGELYSEFDVVTALELARRAAMALENARTFQREHRLASTLQRALLPSHFPQRDTIGFSAAYAAASGEGEAVGGDWYDAFALPDGAIAISMGDVAGHGVEAAVTMNVVRQAIRAAALQQMDPHEVLARANALLSLDSDHLMVTAFFGTIDAAATSMTYAIAGHPRPLLVRGDGSVRCLDSAGAPLGVVFDAESIRTHHVELPPSSTIVMYTDGLLEYNRQIERAEERLLEVAGDREYLAATNPAQALIDRALDGVQRDDIAVLLAHVHGPVEAGLQLELRAKPFAAPVFREALNRFARAAGADSNAAFAILTATGEAIANAIEHAYVYGPVEGSQAVVELRVARKGSELWVDVIDRGHWRTPRPITDRGFGTGLMQALAHHVDIETGIEGTHVAFRFAL